MKKKQKTYKITIDQTYAQTYKVRAKSEAEAKRKAWERFKPKKVLFKLWCSIWQKYHGS